MGQIIESAFCYKDSMKLLTEFLKNTFKVWHNIAGF